MLYGVKDSEHQTDFVSSEPANDVGEAGVSGGVCGLERVLGRFVSDRFVGASEQQHPRALLL